MFENVYKRFFDKQRYMLKLLLSDIDLFDQILLIDFDYYCTFKDMRNSLYICDISRLPTYAKEKLEKANRFEVVCLKHCGLCMVTVI